MSQRSRGLVRDILVTLFEEYNPQDVPKKLNWQQEKCTWDSKEEQKAASAAFSDMTPSKSCRRSSTSAPAAARSASNSAHLPASASRSAPSPVVAQQRCQCVWGMSSSEQTAINSLKGNVSMTSSLPKPELRSSHFYR